MADETAQQTDSNEAPQNDSAGSAQQGQNANTIESLLTGKLDDETARIVLSELTKARNEAAKYRTNVRELEPLAQKARELEEAGRSDIEKLTTRVTEAERAVADRDLQNARLTAAITHGIDVELVSMLNGSTADEIAANAEKLAERLGSNGKGLPGRPKEQLRSGAATNDADEDPDERTDPATLAQRVMARLT